MRVLVTNDDGFDAEGLRAIAVGLVDAGHEVVVGAPGCDQSGSGSSLGTIEEGAFIEVAEHRLPGLGDTRVLALNCPPALVAIAFCSGAFGPPPDLVVSGVNDGHNTGRSVLFSSTVGAVLAAQVAGVGGIALSCGFPPHSRHDTAAAVGVGLVQWMDATSSTGLSLNVNVPDVDLDELRGVRVTELAGRSMFALRFANTETGVVLHRQIRTHGFVPGTDSAAVAEGFVSVTALRGVGDDNDPLPAGPAMLTGLADALGVSRAH